MRQGGDGLRLPTEARESVGILRSPFGQDLDGDLAVEPRVPGPIDLPHPARAQRREDLVGAEAVPGGERHGRFFGDVSASSSVNQFVTRWSSRTMPESSASRTA